MLRSLALTLKLLKSVERITLKEMEEIFILWIQDLIKQKNPLSTAAICEQTLVFYAHLNKKTGGLSNKDFCASKGWFEKFKNRYSLHNIAFTGESAFADHEAAKTFLDQLQNFERIL